MLRAPRHPIVFITPNYIHSVDEKLSEWLKPPDSSSKQNELWKGRTDGTGEWLFESVRFEEWREQAGFFFWIYTKRELGMLEQGEDPF